jgi:peptidoglycan/xylan/chitin deacetylase (PgdA/CDA1 family)
MAAKKKPSAAPQPSAALAPLALVAFLGALSPALAAAQAAQTAVPVDPALSPAAPVVSEAQSAAAEAYQPLPLRREILHDWEKTSVARPPEIVAGIYELDWEAHDFRNELAVTIDDCRPNSVMADELDILKSRGVKATFFIIGSAFLDARGRPTPRAKELLERVVSEGHAIGSHSYAHRRLDERPYRDNLKALARELDRAEAAIDKVLGYHYPIVYFRPPNGAHSTPRYELDRLLRARGQYLANWTITSFDWCLRLKEGNRDRLSSDAVVARTVKQAREDSGGVILLHGFPETAAMLGRALDALAASRNARGGFEFVGLDEIMRLKYEGK